MPGVELGVRRAAQDEASEIVLLALVDSGADATIIPLHQLQRIKAKRLGEAYIRGIAGTRIAVVLYRVALRIGPHLVRGVRAVADPSNQNSILGRDVLNQLVVTLNGLASVTEISA